KTWKLYEGGFAYKGLDKINSLIITKKGDTKETMIILFPPSSQGEDRQLKNLYVGTLQFKDGTYFVKLPQNTDEWSSSKEIKLCPLSYMDYSFIDISGFQK